MVSMTSIIPKAKTPYLAIFKNRQISIIKKKMVYYEKYIEKTEFSEIDEVCTSEAENLNLTYSVCVKYDFNSPEG